MSGSDRPEARHEMIRARLSAWLDDDLDEDDRAEVRAHLRDCAACRALLGDLERIREEARTLSPLEPDRDLWPGIRAAMVGVPARRGRSPDAELAAPAEDADEAPGGRRSRGAGAAGARAGLFLTLPQLAAAALVVLAIGVSGGVWLAPVASAEGPGAASPTAIEAATGAPSPEVAPGPTSDVVADGVTMPAEARDLEEEAERLRADFEERSGALHGRTVRTVADNLANIDRAIREAEAAYARSPGSAFLERHLVESHRRKVTYLRDAVAVTSWGADG